MNQPAKKSKEKIELKDYLEAKAKEAKKKKNSQMPLPVKIFLLSPFLIIFCFGIFYIPFMIYQIATGKAAVEQTEKGKTLEAKR